MCYLLGTNMENEPTILSPKKKATMFHPCFCTSQDELLAMPTVMPKAI